MLRPRGPLVWATGSHKLQRNGERKMVSGDRSPGGHLVQLTLLTQQAHTGPDTVPFEFTNSITRGEPLWSLSDHEGAEAQRGDATHSNLTGEEVEPSFLAPIKLHSFSEPCPSWALLFLLPSIQRDIKEQWTGAEQSSAILCSQFPHLTQLLSSGSDSLAGQQPVASPSSFLFG